MYKDEEPDEGGEDWELENMESASNDGSGSNASDDDDGNSDGSASGSDD